MSEYIHDSSQLLKLLQENPDAKLTFLVRIGENGLCPTEFRCSVANVLAYDDMMWLNKEDLKASYGNKEELEEIEMLKPEKCILMALG